MDACGICSSNSSPAVQSATWPPVSMKAVGRHMLSVRAGILVVRPIICKPVPRVDIPAKGTGGEAYVQDMRLPGMVHARVVRPPSCAARLSKLDTSRLERMPGLVKVVRDGNFLAVVCEQEFQAVKAMRSLAAGATWSETPSLPK